MPMITVKTAGKLSREQKQAIAAEMTDTLERIAGKEKRWTYIVFEEVELENWAWSGRLLDETE